MLEKRQPWNAFPLASLSVRKLHPDISPCAADILRYLAIRSNWRGETVVGQRRIKDDIGRSKDYVTRGLRELEEKKLVTAIGRKRADSQADKHIISPTILPKEYQDILAKATSNDPTGKDDGSVNDPDSQDDSIPNDPDGEVNNPDSQDFRNPDLGSNDPDGQDETLQNEPYRRTNNLTGLEPKNQKKERREGDMSSEASPPHSVPSQEQETSFEKFLANELPDRDLCNLMSLMRKVWREDVWLKELPHAQAVLGEAHDLGFNPMAMLLWNRCHRKGGLIFRSFPQWAKALSSESGRTLEDYLSCRDNPCDICQKNNYKSWTQVHPFLGVDAIHCECSNPHVLADAFLCQICLMINREGVLEPSKEKLRAEWEEAEAKRLNKLARFEFRRITVEEADTFKTLRRDGWTNGCVKLMKERDIRISDRHTEAAALWFLKLGQPVSWDDFTVLVEQIADLDTSVEPPEFRKPPQ
jgi:hypothetical protein